MFMENTQRQSMMEQQIEQQAAMLAEKFVNRQQTETSAVTKEQAHMVYKILNTPAEMIITNMSSMQPQVMIQFYRKLAI